MKREELQARVQEKVDRADFFFPEDLAREIAKELGVETEGTFLGQDPAAKSRTRGDVPPFSGRPANEEVAAEGANEDVARFDELDQERRVNKKDGTERITRADIRESDDLETEVDEEGPIYPDLTSTDTDNLTAGAVTGGSEEPKVASTKKSTTKKGS